MTFVAIDIRPCCSPQISEQFEFVNASGTALADSEIGSRLSLRFGALVTPCLPLEISLWRAFGDVLSGRILYKHVPPGLRPSRPTPFSTVAVHVVS